MLTSLNVIGKHEGDVFFGC